MHPDLVAAFEKLVEILKADERCKGGWQYGSLSRSEEDLYSDYDPVFLVDDKDFEAFAADVPKFLKQACDELVICWPENYNDAHFKNFCSVLKIGENLHQHDFFIMNAGYPMTWFCRQHLKGCSRKNLIFDRTGEVGILLDKGLRTDSCLPDIKRAMDTYWFHIEMLIKYFKRQDIFKLIKNIDMIFNAHVDLLLAQYDTLDYGAWETKVKKCVPKEKQAHLLAYFVPADFGSMENMIRACMQYFKTDALDACKAKGIAHSDRISELVITYFDKRMTESEWK